MTDADDGDDAAAQAGYDASPDLRALLTEAAKSPTGEGPVRV